MFVRNYKKQEVDYICLATIVFYVMQRENSSADFNEICQIEPT